MSIFIDKHELAEKQDIVNPNLFTGSKDFTGNWLNAELVKQKDKYLDFTAVHVDWQWKGLTQFIDVKKDEVLTVSAYVKANAGSSISLFAPLSSNNENGHTKVDTSPLSQEITTAGDGQRVSFCFRALDNGTIKPRVESDGTVQFWIAGMKLERGGNATPWCPAYEDYVMKSDKVLTVKNLIQALFSDELVNIVDDNFDMNSAQPGIYRSWGKKPINAPNDCVAWAKYFVIPFIEGNSASMFQVAIDTNGNIFTRAKGGDPATWISWYKVNLGE